MMGNFIDFAALDKVEESKLMELIDRAPDITVDEDTLEQLRDRAATARTLVLITDREEGRSPTTRHWRTRSRSASLNWGAA